MLHSAVGRLTKDAAQFGDEAAAGLTQENLTELEAKEEELRLSEEQAFEEARFEDAERYSQQKTLTHSELEDMRKTWGEQKRDREDAGHEFSQLLAQGEGIASMLTRSLEDKKRALNKQANRNYAALKRTKGQLDMVTGELERLRPLGNVLRADATHETHECSPDDLVEWFANRREAAVSKRLQGLRAGPASVAEELEEVLSKEAKSAAEALRATAGEWFCASTLETHKDQIDEELRRVSALVMHALESLKADNLSKLAT
ncbi:hypothetical protein T484DRAFT_1764334 [Baffinella frigidus]|nr:hypothetical protein T484DRAFT_1764334 [Cryptophyta sp. CCMP2293]